MKKKDQLGIGLLAVAISGPIVGKHVDKPESFIGLLYLVLVTFVLFLIFNMDD